MAVVFPSKGDKAALSTFMNGLRNETTESDACATFIFRPDNIAAVESCCDTVLEQVHIIANFFTAGGPLTGRKVLHDSLTNIPGSVFPHARQTDAKGMPKVVLSDGSAADIFGVADPVAFFGAMQEELKLAQTRLESAKETLQKVNKAHAYVWTSDLSAIKQYLGTQGEESLTVLYTMNGVKTRMRPSGADSIPTDSGNASASARVPTVNEGSSEEQALRLLLAVPTEKLPSPIVKLAYARFVQTSELLLCWLRSVLQMVHGDDDIPKAGKYTVPLEQSSVDGAADAHKDATPQQQTPVPDVVVQAARTRTVRVRRFEIHDAHLMYDNFEGQAKYFFLPEYTVYDARIQKRLLQPVYYNALRDLLVELTNEINRLRDIAARKTRVPVYINGDVPPFGMYASPPIRVTPELEGRRGPQGEGLPEIVFRPPLSSFCFLRDSLHIYLSTCINEDDTSSLLYYESVYEDSLAQARETAQTIQRLPKPPARTAPNGDRLNTLSISAASSDARSGATAGPQLSGSMGLEATQANHSRILDDAVAQERRLSGWPPTQEERGVLISGFESYWEVRDRMYDLKNGLTKDVRQKDHTHRTRLESFTVQKEKTLAERKAQVHQQQAMLHDKKAAASSSSMWAAMKSSLESLGGALTCKAELPSEMFGDGRGAISANGNVDDEGNLLTTTSPLSSEKQKLLQQVNRLWAVVEAQGQQLETTYPGVFFRGEREKWATRLGKLAKKAESVSVVFSP